MGSHCDKPIKSLLDPQRDSYQSFATRTYTSAMRAANKQQSAALKAELKWQNIRTSARA
jgi:hypothetical protein